MYCILLTYLRHVWCEWIVSVIVNNILEPIVSAELYTILVYIYIKRTWYFITVHHLPSLFWTLGCENDLIMKHICVLKRVIIQVFLVSVVFHRLEYNFVFNHNKTLNCIMSMVWHKHDNFLLLRFLSSVVKRTINVLFTNVSNVSIENKTTYYNKTLAVLWIWFIENKTT